MGNGAEKCLEFYWTDKMIYRDGWFVYVSGKGEVSVLTRQDARDRECFGSYYNITVGDNKGGIPSHPPLDRMFGRDPVTGKYFYKNSKYEVDNMGSPFRDFKIGKELVIPQYVGEFEVNTIYRDTFQFLEIESLILPNSIKIIQTNAFSYCPYLRTVKMPYTAEIQRKAFTDCPAFIDPNGKRILRN